MNEKQFLIQLGRHITEDRGGVCKYAQQLGVSASYVSDVKQGRKRPNQAILDDMGMRIETIKTRRFVRVGR